MTQNQNQTIIKDVIHRFARVPELCKKFMDTPEFNRLRRIKQLGLAYYVFPSATHTRFEHCVGTMFIAGKVIDVLGGVTEREKELVQLAAFAHDVGHTAFAHLADSILIEKGVRDELVHHENRSIFILKQVNSRLKLLTDREIEMVSKMILGDIRNEEKPFLFEIVSNKTYGLDVDRLDYLQRDMYYTGMPCFQADYIIECMRIKDGRLAVLKKARSELEMMFCARRRLFMLVCRHKTVMKVEKIIREIIDKLGIIGDWFETNWIALDDFRIHCMMEDRFPELLNRIYTRDWPDVDIDERFKHVHFITREEIDSQLDNVLWF